jgi:gluconate kinase
MPPRLLAAQLLDLEPLQPDEPGIAVDATRALDDIAAELAALFAPPNT